MVPHGRRTRNMEVTLGPDGRLAWHGETVPCAVGRGGILRDKREGDGATPAGRFPFRRLLYRADRISRPMTGLPVERLAESDGWCDDPADPRYNRQVRLPYPARCERLWREDPLYDVILIIGHNDAPVVPGRGSAVFVHVARSDLAPTEGCVALRPENLLALAAALAPGDGLRIEESLRPAG